MPERIGPYEVCEEIGKGGMAVVWRAWDSALRRDVAIKMPKFDEEPSESKRREMERLFKKEGIASGQLQHPNIVQVYAADESEGKPVIVMEYVKGTTLADMLKSSGPLEPETALFILDGILDGLGHAHSCGVVHRDLKPGNIFIDEKGTAKIGDFGIARIDDCPPDLVTRTGVRVGTERYMSPEQGKSARVDCRSDLFSLGVVAYEMLSGVNPFGLGDTPKNVADVSRYPLPPVMANAIMAALSNDPNDRPATAEAMKAALHGEVVTKTKVMTAGGANGGQSKIGGRDVAGQREAEGRVPNPTNGRRSAGQSKPLEKPRWPRYAPRAIAIAAVLVIAFFVAKAGLPGSAKDASTSGAEASPSVAASSASTPTAKAMVLVPDVSQLSEADAVAKIEAAGLKAVERAGEYSSAVAKGKVVSQSPAAETKVSSGTEVEYCVSLGASVLRFSKATASSVLEEEGDYHGPETAMDGDYTTAWNENADDANLEDAGVGEWIKFEFGTSQTVKGIDIVGGFPKYLESGADIYYQNARPKDILVTFSDGKSEELTLLDKRAEVQHLAFKASHKTSYIKIAIKSVYPGELFDDCCIAEVSAF